MTAVCWFKVKNHFQQVRSRLQNSSVVFVLHWVCSHLPTFSLTWVCVPEGIRYYGTWAIVLHMTLFHWGFKGGGAIRYKIRNWSISNCVPNPSSTVGHEDLREATHHSERWCPRECGGGGGYVLPMRGLQTTRSNWYLIRSTVREEERDEKRVVTFMLLSNGKISSLALDARWPQ